MEQQFKQFEIRNLVDNSLSIVCKVNDYTLSKELRGKNGSFRELVPKDTWQKAIEENPDVKFYYNHKDYFELADSIKLTAEDDGVYLYATLKESEKGLYQAIKDGLISGMSFGFQSLKDTWQTVGSFMQRTINDMNLFEVSILDKTPAYNGTVAEVRELLIPFNDIEIKKKKLELLKLI